MKKRAIVQEADDKENVPAAVNQRPREHQAADDIKRTNLMKPALVSIVPEKQNASRSGKKPRKSISQMAAAEASQDDNCAVQ